MEYKSELPDETKVAWNLAMRLMNIMGDLLTDSHLCANQGNFSGWFYILLSLRREVDYKLSDKEEEEINSLITDAAKSVKEWQKYANSKEKNMPSNIYSDTYLKIDKLERKLRKLLGKYGFLMPEMSDPRYALMGGK